MTDKTISKMLVTMHASVMTLMNWRAAFRVCLFTINKYVDHSIKDQVI